jgi:hypothetical protein
LSPPQFAITLDESVIRERLRATREDIRSPVSFVFVDEYLLDESRIDNEREGWTDSKSRSDEFVSPTAEIVEKAQRVTTEPHSIANLSWA